MPDQPEPPPVEAATAQVLDTGRWRIRTCGATYFVDIDARTAVRLPAPEGLHDFRVAQLRRDAELLRLLESPTVLVGEPMVLHLLVREDGLASTSRFTTPVLDLLQL
jgi:hypothetical protein